MSLYHRGGTIEVIMRDDFGGKIETRTANVNSQKELARIHFWLWEKYGISLLPYSQLSELVGKEKKFLDF